jgi:hypothetical protein
MIGAIDEAKEKAKNVKPVAKAESAPKTDAKGDPKAAGNSEPKAKPEPQPKAKPKPEVEHAAANTHAS